ncbi:hypothetical protein [Chloroflexus sp.]|uniref:hypothetical protein n=1 Tax=Chloroflexus sp. TaxID=1904827 RepID=UPI002ADE59A0|nr:hypothetical protein [Chloroflexus sp.]
MSAILRSLAAFIRERLPQTITDLLNSLQTNSRDCDSIPIDDLRPALQRSVEAIYIVF